MSNQSKKTAFNTYTIAVIGLLTAVVFVATKLYVPIPTALGKTRLHLGNVFCLLCGMLLGGFRGGLAAGIGSMLFDLTDPAFIDSAPFTLVFKFAMAYICGSITNAGGADSKKPTRNLLGAAVGSLTYVALYLGKSFVMDYYLLRNPIETVIASVFQKGAVSLFNAVVASAASVILIPVFSKVFEASGFKERIG